MKIKFVTHKLFLFSMMFAYVFSCQYSQNKSQTNSPKKLNTLNKMKKTEDIHVLLLKGGLGSERDVSLRSAKAW